MQSYKFQENEESKARKQSKLVINTLLTKYKVVKDVAKSLKLKITKNDKDDWDLCWIDTGMTTDKLFKMKPYQKINHFPGMSAVARKNFLGKNLLRMKKSFPKDYNFFPTTYLLPQDWNEFKARFANKKPKTFIVKPEASCQGQGIFLTRTYTDLVPSDHYVVQRYLHKPYLIEGLKFDLRIYVLILGCDPMRIYIYNEGLARFATEEYKCPTTGNLDNFFMHLTNYAINKNSENFIFNSDEKNADTGHKRSLSSIWNTIDHNGGDSNAIIRKIEGIIVKTMCAVQPTLQSMYRSCQGECERTRCFEILGFDILLDYKLKPWLLEVNHSPSFSVDTPFDYKVKFDLISNAINLLNMKIESKNTYKANLRQELQAKIAKKQAIDAMQRTLWKENGFLENEKTYIGNFKLLYPCEEIDYDAFIRASRLVLDELAGIRKKPKEEAISKLPSKSPLIKKDFNSVIHKPRQLSRPKQVPVAQFHIEEDSHTECQEDKDDKEDDMIVQPYLQPELTEIQYQEKESPKIERASTKSSKAVLNPRISQRMELATPHNCQSAMDKTHRYEQYICK